MGHFRVVRRESGMLEEELDAQPVAEALGDRGAVVWVDLDAPSTEELCALEGLFGIHPLAISPSSPATSA